MGEKLHMTRKHAIAKSIRKEKALTTFMRPSDVENEEATTFDDDSEEENYDLEGGLEEDVDDSLDVSD